MKLKSLGLIIASVLLTSVFSGCGTTDQKSALPESELVTISGTGSYKECSWSFARGSGNKVVKQSLVITKGAPQCGIYETDKLFIGDAPNNVKAVLDIPAVAFRTEGSCRYCYTNTSGGMSCVTYPGPPC